MSIKFQCGCGKAYSVSEQLAGKRAKCKLCGATIEIPTPGADGPLAELDTLWDEEALPKPSESQRTPQPGKASRQQGSHLRKLNVIAMVEMLRAPGGILKKTLAAAVIVPLLFALMSAFVADGGGVVSLLALFASSVLAAVAALVLSMFDYVKQQQQHGKMVTPILRILFTRSLFHIVGWAILIGVGIVVLLISLFEP